MNDNPAYELFDELGRGENTVVYRAYDLDLGRDVAIKELNEQSRKDTRRALQFLKEASFLAQFEHENILRVYSVDKKRGWIVMELMKGTLASKIASEPMGPNTVRSVMRQILGALDSLHQKGKVHGAVRPSNILINELGTAKLSDFEATDSDGELRAPTGSKKSLAPELIRPEFGEFGPSVDLYCLGFTVLELLTGPKFESLFPGTGEGAIDADVGWLRWHSSPDSLKPVKELCPHVPDDLANVIDQLISKEVADRPESAQEVLGLLDEQAFIPVAVDEPESTPSPASASLPPLTSSVREIGNTTRKAKEPTAKKSTRKQKAATVANKTTKDKVNDFLGKPYVLWPLCAAMLIGAVLIGLQLQKANEPDVATPQPTPITEPIAEPVRLANVRFQIEPSDAILFLNDQETSLTDRQNVELEPGEYRVSVAKDGYSPHQETLVVGNTDKQVSITLQTLPPPEPILANLRLTIEPSAENAVVSINGADRDLNEGLLVLKPGTYELQVRKQGFENHAQTVSVDPGDSSLVVTLAPFLPPETVDFVKISVSMPAEAKFLLGDDVIEFPDADTERVEFEVEHRVQQGLAFQATQEGYNALSRSIDWETLAASKFKVNVSLDPVADLAKSKTTEPVEAISDPLDTLFVKAEDANRIHKEKAAELAKEFTGKADLVIDSGGFMSEINDISFSPDGTLIAVGSGKLVRIWNVTTGELIMTLRGDKSRTSYGNVHACEFSPDGKTLLVGINDYKKHGSIREYSTADFTEINRLIPGHTAPCRKIAFSGSGKHRISADSDGNVLIVDTASERQVGNIRASDPKQPIFDFISFPDANEDAILAIDAEGPKVFSMDGSAILSPEKLPKKFLGWLMDVFGKKVRYPFDHTKDPRILDFAMERNEWVAADVTLVNGANKFWAAVFASRDGKPTDGDSRPLQTYVGHRWRITAVELGPSGRYVASGDKFGEVHVWDRKTGKAVHKLKCQGKSIYEVAFDQNSNRIAFGTKPFKPDTWNRNNYGKASRVLDLRQRAILPLAANDDLSLDNERPKQGALEVDVTKTRQDPSFFVNLKKNNQVLSRYKISSARNPTVYTLIDQPKLGVNVPVVFGDNEGLLALWDTSRDELKRAFIGHGSLVSGVSFSRNGKLMVSASTDRTIQIWSLEDHIPTGTFDFKYENSAVTKVLLGSSSAQAGIRVGDKIITMDGLSITEIYQRMLDREFEYRPGQVVPMQMKRDGKEFTYNMKMAEGYDFVDPTLSFYVGDDDQWIIWSPTGYYDASPGAEELIGWHVNRGPDKSAKFYRVQQFREQLYRPDIIDLILEGKDVTDAVRVANAARKLPATSHDLRSIEEIAELHPPEVTILSPKPDSATTASTIDFAANIESPNGLPIEEATLLLNGNAIKVFHPTDLNSDTLELRYAVELSAGRNRLELIASNGRTLSANVGVTVNYEAKQAQPLGDVHVLAIGISNYKQQTNVLSSLTSAERDANLFAKTVSAHENGKLYENVHAKLLTNEDATRTQILDGFQWLVDSVKPNDSAIIFFSGYGFVDSTENFYLATHEVETERPRATAVSWREFIDMLHEDLPACKRLVFLDARPTAGGLKPGMRNPLLDLAAPQLGTTFFASNTLQQAKIPSKNNRGNGHFMQAILDTLRDSKSDQSPRDQLLNPVELARSIRTRVQHATAGRQLPTFFASTEQQRRRNLLELNTFGNQN